MLKWRPHRGEQPTAEEIERARVEEEARVEQVRQRTLQEVRERYEAIKANMRVIEFRHDRREPLFYVKRQEKVNWQQEGF